MDQRFLKQAIEYEIARQVAILENGGTIHQETRLFNSDTGETVGMRSKEDAHDYRYFPEPDLVPLRISEEWRTELEASMPELPAARRTMSRNPDAASGFISCQSGERVVPSSCCERVARWMARERRDVSAHAPTPKAETTEAWSGVD